MKGYQSRKNATKSKGRTRWGSIMFALSQIHTITLALQEKGIVGASEWEEMRNKTLEAIRRVEKVKDNGG